MNHRLVSPVVALAVLLLQTPGSAAPPLSKEACLETYSRAQDARDSGQLIHASKLFLTCAQSSCPSLVQADCARFADEVDRLQPTVTFAARDSSQTDLLDTSVSVDGNLIASRLGDAKAYPLDPGRHDVRFLHGGKETVLTVVVNPGEKGRPLVGLFASSTPETSTSKAGSPVPPPPEPKRPSLPLYFAAVGAASLIAGGVVMGVGFSKVPSNCNIGSRECAAQPGDPVFDQAASAVKAINVGGVLGGIGLAGLGGGLVWYYSQTPRPPHQAPTVGSLAPWFSSHHFGLMYTSEL